jgi:hypothetical protein
MTEEKMKNKGIKNFRFTQLSNRNKRYLSSKLCKKIILLSLILCLFSFSLILSGCLGGFDLFGGSGRYCRSVGSVGSGGSGGSGGSDGSGGYGGSGGSRGSGVFGAYIEGSEAAREANWRDERTRASILIQRQRIINQAINLFNRTGDFRYLCVAASHGSDKAAEFLYYNNIRCVN